jgi:hypothetical protein
LGESAARGEVDSIRATMRWRERISNGKAAGAGDFACKAEGIHKVERGKVG